MTTPHEVTVDGKKITISKFGAIEGWKLAHKLVSTVGPSLASVDSGNAGDAVSLLFEKCDEDQLINLLKQLTSVCLIDGVKVNFGADCAEYMFTIKICREVLEYNFEDFFSPIKELFNDFVKDTTVKR